jgi:hypothetical protein
VSKRDLADVAAVEEAEGTDVDEVGEVELVGFGDWAATVT